MEKGRTVDQVLCKSIESIGKQVLKCRIHSTAFGIDQDVCAPVYVVGFGNVGIDLIASVRELYVVYHYHPTLPPL